MQTLNTVIIPDLYYEKQGTRILLDKTGQKISMSHQIGSISHFTSWDQHSKWTWIIADSNIPSSPHTYSHTHTQKQGHATHSYTTENKESQDTSS